MPKDGKKSESTKSSESSKGDSGLHFFEGKSSGDQGVYLQPLGTQDNNPFNPPQQPSSQVQPSDNPGSSQSDSASSQTSDSPAPKGE